MQQQTRLGPMDYKCSRESVERAFEIHGIKYTRFPEGGYDISTGIGVLHVKSLREAALVVIGAAEGKRHMERTEVEAR